MSLAEILDHGAPHQWANLRINTLSIDNGITEFNGRVVSNISGKTTLVSTGAAVTLITLPVITPNTVTMFQIDVWGYCTAGPNANQSTVQRFLQRVRNTAGVLNTGNAQNANNTEYATGMVATISGTNILIQINPPAGNTIRWNYVVITYVDNI